MTIVMRSKIREKCFPHDTGIVIGLCADIVLVWWKGRGVPTWVPLSYVEKDNGTGNQE